MKELKALTVRHIKLFFHDAGMLASSMITPIILLVLYATFLGSVYRDLFMAAVPQGISVPGKLIDAFVGGQLVSSLLTVCCVTVAFGSNLIMVQDRYLGIRRDLTVSPVRNSILSVSYYLATAVNTLIVCYLACAISFFYLWMTGWYLNTGDILMILLDVFLLVMFGTALSSIVNSFLSTQGQMSAVGTIVSAGYGFICGAYMPISQFGEGLQKVLSFSPGTYGTSLLRNHTMRGAIAEMGAQGVPEQVLEGLKDGIDCNLYFFGNKVEPETMYLIIAGSVAVLLAIYILLNLVRGRSQTK